MRLVLLYCLTIVTLLALDAAWLGLVGLSLFKKTLGDMLAPDVSIAAAGGFYVIYVVGVLFFAALPALDEGAWTTALVRGAAFGFFAYLTYDMTNLATLRNYTVTLALTDTLWGTFVTGASATVGVLATKAIMDRLG